jgi:hypothetical protein
MNSLEAKQESVNQQGANVRALKAQGAPQEEIAAAIEELKRLKVDLETELTGVEGGWKRRSEGEGGV